MRFKSWKDNYIFLRDYGNCNCLNCYYGGAVYTDDSETHTDTEYAHLFCRESISMVRLDFMIVCAKWRHQDTGKSIEEVKEDDMWLLSSEVIDILDKDNREWSIEDIKRLVNEHQKDN